MGPQPTTAPGLVQGDPAFDPRCDFNADGGVDVADLLTSITHNIVGDAPGPYFQRKVAYDNLPVEAVAELKPLVEKKAQALLEELDVWLAARDRARNDSLTATNPPRG